MAGHSKWSKVKRGKGALDVKRGQLFSKLSKEITVAVRMGGGDPSGNPRLRAAVLATRAIDCAAADNDTPSVHANFDFPKELLAKLPA